MASEKSTSHRAQSIDRAIYKTSSASNLYPETVPLLIWGG